MQERHKIWKGSILLTFYVDQPRHYRYCTYGEQLTCETSGEKLDLQEYFVSLRYAVCPVRKDCSHFFVPSMLSFRFCAVVGRLPLLDMLKIIVSIDGHDSRCVASPVLMIVGKPEGSEGTNGLSREYFATPFRPPTILKLADNRTVHLWCKSYKFI